MFLFNPLRFISLYQDDDGGGTGGGGGTGDGEPGGTGDGGGTGGGGTGTGDGGQQAGWFESLPDELRNAPSLKSFEGKDVPELAKALVHAQQMIGGSVKVPGEGATEEDWNKFYTKVGRPENVEGYEVTPPMLQGGVEIPPENIEGLKTFAHKNGLSNSQLSSLVNYLAEEANSDYLSSKEALEAGLKPLKDGWGKAFEKNLALASRAIQTFDPSGDLMKALSDSGAENHPSVIKFFHGQGVRLMEDGLIVTDATGPVTRERAADKIKEIMSDPKHPYFIKGAVGHKEAVEEMARLQSIVHPEVGERR